MSFLERVDQTIRRSVVWRSLFRQPYPSDERSRAYAVMNNVFLHIHPVRVRQHAVKFAYTFCLGGLSFFLFLVLTVTGVYLMFWYTPSATQAYTDILNLQTEVTFGLLTRNIHRWGAHLMVFFVFLHMMRVFYHGAYKPPREFNWVIGVVLLIRAIDILKTFGMIWALFGNATSTRVMPIHIYTVGIQTQDHSQGAVLSLILAGVSVLVYWGFQRGFGRRVLAQE